MAYLGEVRYRGSGKRKLVIDRVFHNLTWFFSFFVEHQIAEVFAQPIYRDSDFNITLGGKKFLNLMNRETSVSDDFLEVTVRFRDGSKQTELHASVSEIHDVAQRRETHRAPLNIMILTFDGTSAAHFERMLPKTHTYLKDELDSIIFKGYSIVGESTTPAMSAFLTGKSLEENCKFREARKDVKNASFVDEWPLIFKDLKHLGIATMWSEDQPQIGKKGQPQKSAYDVITWCSTVLWHHK